MATPYSRDLSVASSHTVTFGANALLSTLLTINPRLKALGFQAASGVTATISRTGNAGAGTWAIPVATGSFILDINAGDAALLYEYGNGAVNILQYV